MNIRNALIGLSVAAVAFTAAAAEQKSSDGPTRLGGIAISVSDLDKATAYYRTIGFLEEQRHGEAPKRTQYMNIDANKGTFENPGLVLSEVADGTSLTLGNAYNVIIFLVKDAKVMCQKLADAKMPCFRDAHAEGPNQIISAFARDPDGHVVEFIEPKH